MKLSIFFILLLVQYTHSSWLGDVFLGLGETAEEALAPLKENPDDVYTHTDKKSILRVIPATEVSAKELRRTLRKAFHEVIPKTKKKEFKKVLNEFVRKMMNDNENRNIEDVINLFQFEITDLLSSEDTEDTPNKNKIIKLFEQTILEKLPKGLPNAEQVKREVLEESLKSFDSSSSIEEGLKEFKGAFYSYLKEAISKVNEGIAENKQDKTIDTEIPIDSENPQDQQKLREWVKRHFVKPHVKTGESPWEKLFRQRWEEEKDESTKKKKYWKRKEWVKAMLNLIKKDVQQMQALQPTVAIPSKDVIIITEAPRETKARAKQFIKKVKQSNDKQEGWEERLVKEAKKLFKKNSRGNTFKLPSLTQEQVLKMIQEKEEQRPIDQQPEVPKKDQPSPIEEIKTHPIVQNGGMMTGNENWDKYKKSILTPGTVAKPKARKNTPVPYKKYNAAAADLKWAKQKNDGVEFSKNLNDQTYNWFDVTRKAYAKLDFIKKHFKNKGF